MKTTTSVSYSIPLTPGYFTGSEYGIALIREELRTNDHDELVWYFNDLYKLFLHHYAALGHEMEMAPEEEVKMTAMLAELCKVKRMMAGSIEKI
ncbi:MAG TPA: hypothetical protein VGE18_02655 [Candidatus Paceibacterota bacterium]